MLDKIKITFDHETVPYRSNLPFIGLSIKASSLLYVYESRYFMSGNSLKKVRESLLMSKTELARKANVSPITIARIEKGLPCRMETQRKILLALGFNLADKGKIFKD